MLKVIILNLFYISFIVNFEAESITIGRRKTPTSAIDALLLKCNTSYDCYDFRMICLKELCKCAKFHDWEPSTKRCIVNISRISHWLEATASTDPGYVSQQEDFDAVELNGSIILRPKWAEYEGEKETGIGHITRVIWPIMLGSLLIFVIYGAILLEFL